MGKQSRFRHLRRALHDAVNRGQLAAVDAVEIYLNGKKNPRALIEAEEALDNFDELRREDERG